MQGVKLLPQVEEYWTQVAFPALKREFPQLYSDLAAGLVGNGSECFGFDDLISRDHDWGVDFSLWVKEADQSEIKRLKKWKEQLFCDCPPRHLRHTSEYGASIGISTVGDFYLNLIGISHEPQTLSQWYRIPEENLALAVNGAVFWDGPGLFTSVRTKLLHYYPEDIRKKKIAVRCMSIAQTGQYNYSRMFGRQDRVAMHIVLSRFVQDVIKMVYHLNRAYCPYYKWMWKGMRSLPILGEYMAVQLRLLTQISPDSKAAFLEQVNIISDICAQLVQSLRSQGLSDSDDWFLAEHGKAVNERIENIGLKDIPPQCL